MIIYYLLSLFYPFETLIFSRFHRTFYFSVLLLNMNKPSGESGDRRAAKQKMYRIIVMCNKMKKVILFLGLAAGLTLAACSGKSADQNAAAGADTIVVDNGTVQVDSITPDSAEVTVTDTAAVLVAEPAK
jgi:hypothetical protein